MTLQLDPISIARTRIAEEAERRTGSLNLSNLKLEALPKELASLTALKELDCSRTQVTDLAPLASLTALKELDCSRTQVTDLAPLASLTALKKLDCSGTQVTDLAPLAGLTTLQSLDCFSIQVTDLAPLAGLTTLQSLVCFGTQVTDLTPLAGLTALKMLNCSYTQVTDLTPLAGLTALQLLFCSGTQVTDLTPLADLTALNTLNCSSTQVTDLTPLAGLTALNTLSCSSTQVTDLAPLADLTALNTLNCSSTQVTDLTPLAGLTALNTLNCSGCPLHSLPAIIRDKPSLHQLVLFNSHVPEIPGEVLSQTFDENCLDAVRAHFADLAVEAAILPDVRLLMIGNGRVGKTQIARWLADEPFNEDWDSTHGIRVSGVPLPGDASTRLQIWDFGGQDIYHGTHALFLRNPAVLVVVWAEEEEKLAGYEHGGLTFRNHPLAYWIEMVRHLTDPHSPVLILQNKCDRPEQEVLPFPIPGEALEALHSRYRKQLHVSTKERLGEAALMEGLSGAITWLRDPALLGLQQIGAGRLRVQRRLEALRDDDQALPCEQRRHRLLERPAFEAICAEEGGVTDTALLLAYLNANGTIFYRPGLFGDRIVLDQSWAMEAIYVVFERKQVYRELRRSGGRFTRSLLGLLVWQEHSEVAQKLLLDMMQSCGICFRYRHLAGPDDQDIEYIAPDLLPERKEITDRLAPLWDESCPSQEAVFRYALLHGGLIRTVIAVIGEKAGPGALYWRGGLFGFEATLHSRLLIEEEMTGTWQGVIRVRTQGGQATTLLQQAVVIVEEVQAQFNMRPIAVEMTAPPADKREETSVTLSQQKPAQPEWYVSYAWRDDRTPEGQEREQVVDQLCAAAEASGHVILRDKDVMKQGDSIIEFMRRIGAGDRVFVILSDKYLRSPHCMFELSEIWRTSRQETPALLDRVRVYTLGDADIWTTLSRMQYAAYWKKQHDEIETFVHDNGGPSILGERDHAAYRRMGEFYRYVGDILATFADIMQPRNFEDLVRYGFD
jgi:internalin A